MGNEGSMLPGLEIDPKSVENTDDWALHFATSSCVASPSLSVFCGRQTHDHANDSLLEQTVKNLRIYRHPNILKYITSWTNQGQLCLATESVQPLSAVLRNLTMYEICLGLHDILKALIFLHEKAQCSHNNVCSAAVYVAADGSWKLGGLQFLARFSDLKPDFLQKSRSHRYEKAVPPEEDSGKVVDPKAIDTFAFGVLADELLKTVSDDVQVPGIKEFREMSRKQLQSTEPSLRPKLSQLLTQPIFNHRFVIIHDFLSELPLKSDEEKTSFFSGLVHQLREFPEILLANHLSALLLSRMVLLDKTAQEHLLPVILQPQNTDKDLSSSLNPPLFSLSTFQQHIVPRLLLMFSVRDAQIRLLLLEHFDNYISAFSKEQLCTKVLPELLVGIKDTNDNIVASTLRALSVLVPILGAPIVIGGKRARLFTDGRPKPKISLSSSLLPQGRQRLKERPKPNSVPEISSALSIVDLPERPSPDGGEDLALTTQIDEETDNWSDWDLNESQALDESNDADPQIYLEPSVSSSASAIALMTASPLSLTPSTNANTPRAPLPDITSLDIKSSIVSNRKQSIPEEIDFFQDMEPVISKPTLLHLGEVQTFPVDSPTIAKSCFDVDLTTTAETEGGGWGDNEDWGDISDTEVPAS